MPKKTFYRTKAALFATGLFRAGEETDKGKYVNGWILLENREERAEIRHAKEIPDLTQSPGPARKHAAYGPIGARLGGGSE